MANNIYDISSYGIDYPIEVLVSMMKRGDLVIPDFQRNYVWSIGQASRFIESCIANLPIPTIFFFKTDDNKFLIVDGLQRLQTALFYIDGRFGKTGRPFALAGLDNDELNGKTYYELPMDMKRRFEQAVLRATVFTQNKPEKGMQSVYEVFSRLNSGGTKLTSHEVRNAIMRGELNSMLEEMNMLKSWRILYGKKEPDTHRKDEETILRFLALYEDADEYSPPMNNFLNKFMEKRLNPSAEWLSSRKKLFVDSVEKAHSILGKDAFRAKGGAQINIAIADAIIVSFMRNLQQLSGLSTSQKKNLKDKVGELKRSADFIDLVEKNTSDTRRVKGRITALQNILVNL